MEGLHHNAGSGGSMSDGGYEYNDFLEDLEEDAELRKNVNVYKDASKIAGQMAVDDQDSVSDSEDIPQITLAEMLDDLAIGSEHSANSQSENTRAIERDTPDATGLPDTPMVE